MISYLVGQAIVEKDFVTVLVNGVGYAVRVNDTLRAHVAAQAQVELFIYTHVREDALELFGFRTREEREVFVLLLSVSGVGPKTALSILNAAPRDVIAAVQNANTSLFTSVPRVGKKLAQKIIIELRNKLGALKELELGPLSPHRQEVVEALESLGFDEPAIQRSLESLSIEDMTTAEAIRAAMKNI